MHLIIKLLFSPWFWADAFFAVLGGVIVFWGHWMEKDAEKFLVPESFKEDIFRDVIAPYKARKQRGWRILMAGVILETVCAFGISVISGLHVASSEEITAKSAADAASANERASSNELQVAALRLQVEETSNNIAKIDPMNRRLASLTAYATIRFIPAEKGVDWAARLWSQHFLSIKTKTPASFLELTSEDKPEIGSMGNIVVVAMSFHWLEVGRAMQEQIGKFAPYLSIDNATVGQIMDGASFTEMGTFNFGQGTEILDGNVKVNFNGLEKIFPIPPQKVNGDTNDPSQYRFK